MACEDYDTIYGALSDFSGDAPLDAAYCPFVADYGAGMGMSVFSLFLFGFLGLGLTVKTQHPGPILVASMLSVGVIAGTLPGIAAKVMALVLFFGIAGVSLFIYQQMQTSL